MIRHRQSVLSAAFLILTLPATAAAQTDSRHGRECALLGGFAGISFDGPEDSLVVGAAAAWRVLPRIVTEARMSFIRRPPGEDAMTAGLSVQFRLTAGRRALPFVRAGFGMYSATFDLDRTTPPEFYRRRIGAEPAPNIRTFNDPAAIFGAGVDIGATRFVSWRPEIETFVVWRGSRTYVVTTASVQLSFHFEPHRVTPAVAPSR